MASVTRTSAGRIPVDSTETKDTTQKGDLTMHLVNHLKKPNSMLLVANVHMK